MDADRMDVEQTDQMAHWVRQRRDILADILRVTLRQETAIESGMVESLLEVLGEKDSLVDQLRGVQSRLAPMAAVPPAQRQWRDAETREQCGRQIEESARLQAAIVEIDGRCEQAMVERREELFDSLRETTGAAGASRAYASAPRAAHNAARAAAGGSFDLTSG